VAVPSGARTRGSGAKLADPREERHIERLSGVVASLGDQKLGHLRLSE
jgi:hypothetical protein